VVDELARPREGARVLELYAGQGNLTRVLREGARSVVAVDAQTPDAPASGGVSWRKGDVADAIATLAEVGDRFDLAVLDPPRAGAAAVLPALTALRPPRIVYVSCDPATLARDLNRLRATGYTATRAQALDLMPQTAHVEVVVTLEA